MVFDDTLLSDPVQLLEGEPHFLIDANVARLYEADLHAILDRPNTIIIEATEDYDHPDKIHVLIVHNQLV